MTSFERIPIEMRQYLQWVVWRYEERIGGKPTKVPYDPKTGFYASVDDPRTWVSFDHACKAVAENPEYHGIGFVLTLNDPFAFIDLDGTTDQQILERQIRIFHAFDTYAERSPSGTGAHLILKAIFPSGRKRGNVECYSSGRFMTMTGDVIADKPIAERHDLARVLWTETGKTDKGDIIVTDEPQKEDDDTILYKCGNSQSFGQKFRDLFEGNWQLHYPPPQLSQSEADMAFIDMVQLYTRNCEQIGRIFLRSGLGKRAKAQRKDYREAMILKSFDRMAPPMDHDALAARMAVFDPRNANAPASGLAETGASVQGPKPREERPASGVLGSTEANGTQDIAAVNPYTLPPGLMGKIAKFIYDAAPRQVPEIALAGAMGFMAGMCGRAFNTPTGAGLNLYTLLIAKSGRGKEAIQSGVSRLVQRVSRLQPNNPNGATPSIAAFIGPSEIRSDMGLLKELAEKPSMVAMIGEFGLKLQAMTAIHANSNLIGIRGMLLDLYGKSGKDNVLGSSAYSDRSKNTQAILSPAFSLLAETTPSTFYEALSPALIAQGLLPRFLTIEYHGERPDLNAYHTNVDPTPELCTELGSLAATCHGLMRECKVINVKFDQDSWHMSDNYDKVCTRLINAADNEAVAELWNRAHLKALKLACLVAIGCNPQFPTVDAATWQWAETVVTFDVSNVVAHFESGQIGRISDDSEQDKDLIDVVVDYLSKSFDHIRAYCPIKDAEHYHRDHVIPQTYFTMKLQNRGSFKNAKQGYKHAMFNTLRSFIDRGILVEEQANKIRDKATGQPGRYNGTGKVYWIADETQFLMRYRAKAR